MFESTCSPRCRFPGIESLGFVSDGETNFLAKDGDIVWMCLPEMDGPSVFSGLLGGKGHFRVGPTGEATPVARNISDSLGIETEWRTPQGGRVVVTDVLVTGRGGGARQTLVRLIRCTKGKVQVEADLEPVFDYGRESVTWEGSVARSRDGLELRRATDLNRPSTKGGRVRARRTLTEGDAAYIALAWGDHEPPRSFMEAEAQVRDTIGSWRGWLASGRIPQFRFGHDIARSALVLKGLCPLSGLPAAAGTTSLPETPGGIRNWDYRYFWCRDGAMTALALFRLGFREVADGLVRFLEGLPEQDIQIMYGLRGRTRLEEKVLEHLPGYEGAAPVRTGNGAYTQRQNDLWGQLLELIHRTQWDRLTSRTWRLVIRLVDGALKARGVPDRGIWEIRGAPRIFTMSNVYLWVALDRGSKLAEIRGDRGRAREWARTAREMKEEILRGVGERGVFTAAAGDDALDASCLLIPTLGFLPGDDPRVRATVHAVASGLTRNGMLLRYDTERFGDGLPGEEMAFVITGFWLAGAYLRIGERRLAEDWYHKMVRHIGPLGLLAEEIDPVTGRQWGNTPQAFSHLGAIDAGLDLFEASA
ncbi:glycoside hydrolase family 15 protein [Actinomadura vinacea]